MADNPGSILEDAEKNMDKALEALQRSFGRVRAGRASLSLLDGVRVEYYGTPTPLNQVGSLSIPEARLIVIQPWDKNLIPAIEKAIFQSEMDLNPATDGNVIRIPIPKLTEERRRDLVKVVKGMTEEAKVGVRNARRDANGALEKLHKEKSLPEDELRRRKEEIQKLTNRMIEKADQMLQKKEAEILEV
jgi:ribosome recycling factor